MSTTPVEPMEAKVAEFREKFDRVRGEVSKLIVGQRNVIEEVLISLFAGGNCLLEGVPGLGKTLLVRTLGEVLSLTFRRIQFTPDLMPADIIGTRVVIESETGHKEFEFQKGPIFGQIVLADEINRATPKTQSALLEAMQERSVTVAGTIHELQQPFIVLATQNPLEMDGTYPLPEAQLDRFMFKVLVDYPTREELSTVLERTVDPYEDERQLVMDGPEIETWKDLIRQVVVAPHVKDFAVRMVLASHPGKEHAVPLTDKYVRYGSSPRGAQSILLAGKIRALLQGRYNVSFEDLKASAHPALRHRLLLNFEGEAEGIETDRIIDEIIEKTSETAQS